jgi:hypothetical protein
MPTELVQYKCATQRKIIRVNIAWEKIKRKNRRVVKSVKSFAKQGLCMDSFPNGEGRDGAAYK